MSHAGSAGVIGWPVGHSRSPAIHRFWLERLGLDGDYGRFPVAPGRLAQAIAALPALGLAGVNVTVPHKQAVIPLLDRLDAGAAAIGAVNTIVVETGGTLAGHNTDAAGFLAPLRPLLDRPWLFRMARVIGTGGAARAIVHALAGAGFVVAVVGRDPARARALAAEADAAQPHWATLDDWSRPLDFAWDDRAGSLDLLVNATSLGMAGQPPLLFDWSHVPPDAIVYDAVYAPPETPLLAEARARGHRTIDGLHMLVGQAAEAFRLFYGVAPPREADADLRRLLLA